ncbi:MAG: hypothetical protein IPJ49_12970 [Candidatus Obscuribacter sp.]|nr:hypothetical protein [Candidatus Obscuribacter sp.]
MFLQFRLWLIALAFVALALVAVQPVCALEPTASKMLLLKCTGSMLGPVEVFFAPHSFSILNSNGLVIWRDKEPDKVQLLNTENRTVLTVPLDEYIDDISSGLKDLSGSVKTGPTPVVMPDGRKASQIMFDAQTARRGYKVQAVFLPDLKVSPLMVQAWCRIFFVEPQYGMPVTVRHNKSIKRRDLTVTTNPTDKVWRTMIAYKSLEAVPFRPDRFVVPKDFKAAKDKSALYFSVDGVLKKEDIDDLFRSEKSH